MTPDIILAAISAFLPAGKLGQSMGLKTPFLGGCFLITVGTLFSGLSPNLWMLLASRFLQGLGVGAMAALAYAMIPAWLKPDGLVSVIPECFYWGSTTLKSGFPIKPSEMTTFHYWC
ncbi:MAG: MFS transporter [Proteobacteria bacterium]|nr:MFS transporter [Pseudomonadota bacterium]